MIFVDWLIKILEDCGYRCKDNGRYEQLTVKQMYKKMSEKGNSEWS